MQLERADARHDVNDAGQRFGFQHRHQRMDADAEFQIEHNGPVFDEDIAVALLAIDGART